MASRNKAKSASRKARTPKEQTRGGWFGLIVLVFMLFALYIIGALLSSSWTGAQGQLVGEYLRRTWGGALLVPLLFLIYLCIVWFARSRIPRPLGQIVGTLLLYLTTVLVLGLLEESQLPLPWVGAEPGRVGNNLAKFFVVNLGSLGTIIIAFACLALTSKLFGFNLPVRLLQAVAARFVEGKANERENEASVSASKPEAAVNPLPQADVGALLLGELLEPALASTPPDSSAVHAGNSPSSETAEISADMPVEMSTETKVQIATEIPAELTESFNAEKPLIDAKETTMEDEVSFSAASHLATEQIIELQSPMKATSEEQLNGISSAVQEAFPEVNLPEDDGSSSFNKGLLHFQ